MRAGVACALAAASLMAPTAAQAQRAPGTPPTLTCPNQTVLFDWDVVAWAAGSTSNTYPLGNLGNISFNLTNNGAYLNNATFGGQSPTRSNGFTGGLVPAQNSLTLVADQTSRAGRVTVTITLPEIMQGAQFLMFDVDSAAGQFADLVVVEGRLAGATVTPTLTNGAANYIIGNGAYGDGASDNNSANGNVTTTFTSPIDTLIISYGNHSAAPTNPGQQGIGIHDILFCRPSTVVTTTKTQRLVSGRQTPTGNDYHVPGAIIEYCLVASNTGLSPANEVAMTDVLPAQILYSPGSIRSGTTCTNATTIEDDNAIGTDETDPAGASFDNGTVRSSITTLQPNASVSFTFQATIR